MCHGLLVHEPIALHINPIRGFLILVCFVGGLADTDQVPVYVPSSRGTAKWCVLQFADSTNLLYWWLHVLCLQRYVQLKQFLLLLFLFLLCAGYLVGSSIPLGIPGLQYLDAHLASWTAVLCHQCLCVS